MEQLRLHFVLNSHFMQGYLKKMRFSEFQTIKHTTQGNAVCAGGVRAKLI